jgi:hypothetical protein
MKRVEEDNEIKEDISIKKISIETTSNKDYDDFSRFRFK